MQDGKPVILCVDDDPDLLYALRLVLESNGYVMVEAASAEEALRVYEESRPELLIIDLMMEEVDAGASLIRSLQAKGCTQPIYMLSSVGDGLAQSTDYAGLGLSGVFQKPLNNDVLLKTLARKLRR